MSKSLKLKILQPFSKWYTTPKRIKVSYGGRGGGKSESIIRLLLMMSYKHTNCVFLFARETQRSVEHSSKPAIEHLIYENEIDNEFNITKTEITNMTTGVKFMFVGLRECSIDSIKSINNVKICFIEEGQTITEYSYQILDPSIRAENSEIWWAFNPRNESDTVYKIISRFPLDYLVSDYNGEEYPYKEYEDENYLITNINFDGNYYFSDVLNQSRSIMLTENPSQYGHTWLGQLKKSQGKIFNQSQLKYFNYDYYKEELEEHYIKRAIIDPAFGRENCYTSAIIYIMVGRDYYIIDSGLMRNNETSTTDELIVDFLKQYDVKHVMVEANFNQSELVRRLKRLNMFDVKPFTVHKNKIERIVNSQYSIREHCFFDENALKTPNLKSTETWLQNREGRNYIALRQLFDFSDITSENNIKGDDFSYIDFPDALASLMLYGKKSASQQLEKVEIVSFNENANENEMEMLKRTRINNNIGGMGFGIDR